MAEVIVTLYVFGLGCALFGGAALVCELLERAIGRVHDWQDQR